MAALSHLLESLQLQPNGEGSYTAGNVPGGRGAIFGGQLMAQSIVAAAMGHPGKTVKTLHIIFARSGSTDAPVDIDVDVMHTGRAFGSSTVTIRQGDRLCTRALVLLTADEPDLIRHAVAAPAVDGPDTLPGHTTDIGWDVRVVGGVDISDPDAVGPAELDVWSRFDGAPDDPVVSQALLAYATDGFVIGTSMRPHAGVGQAQAHVSISTGVISHTITFHEPFRASDWLLLAHTAPFAGRGRVYGRADVFTQQGALVASFVQDAMVRAMPTGHSPVGREGTYM